MFRQDHRRRFGRKSLWGAIAVLMAAWIGSSTPVSASQEASEDTETTAAQEAEAAAELASSLDAQAGASSRSNVLSKLQIHGFLTQAYAEGSPQRGRFPVQNPNDPMGPPIPAPPTDEEQSLGIPEGGTTDYRNLAIQFRYEISPKDIMIIQFSSRALGDSPLTVSEDDIELDWAFYERRLTDNTSLKVGRVQIPFGIFNEVRDVGTLLPFYRPSFIFYREAAFTSETVDGLALSHIFAPESEWALELNAYAGEWDTVELFRDVALTARNEDSWGLQLWLNTPVPGLRLGAGHQKRHTTEGNVGISRLPGQTTSFSDLFLSLDGVFDRFIVRAEWRSFANESGVVPAFGVNDFRGIFDSYYAQVGFQPWEKVRFFLQYERSDFLTTTQLFTETNKRTAREDVGFSFNYLFSPSVVFKAEYHEVQGEDGSFLPDFSTGMLRLQPIKADMDDGDYLIISLSASF